MSKIVLELATQSSENKHKLWTCFLNLKLSNLTKYLTERDHQVLRNKEIVKSYIEVASIYIDENQVERLDDMGINQTQARLIEQLKPSEVARIIGIKSRKIKISIDESALNLAIKKSEQNYRALGVNPEIKIAFNVLTEIELLSNESLSDQELMEIFDVDLQFIHKIKNRSLRALQRIAQTGIRFYSVTPLEPAFTTALYYACEIGAENRKVVSLIQADASLPMMAALTGMRKSRFQQLRREYDVGGSRCGGKLRTLTEEEEMSVIEVWRKTVGMKMLDRCCEISNEIKGIEMRHIWPLIQSWDDQNFNFV